MMIKFILKSAGILILLYAFLCILLYIFQEKIIFLPQKLAKNHKFRFSRNFEEINTKTPDGIILNSLLFKVNNSKGLIFYLHGNAGSLENWGEIALVYTALGYDLFMPDYRGYGKSEGTIGNEQQIYDDVQLLYNKMKIKYGENKIIILGYSIGTGPAAKLAADNNPKLLILQAPYYSLPDIMKQNFPIVPKFLLKYKFENYKYLQKCTAPIVIFHGNKDEVIYYGSSLKLKKENSKIRLITLNNQKHNGMSDNEEYRKILQKLLN
jgi:pimeloyl-ACP methyl ester carboxylesterase